MYTLDKSAYVYCTWVHRRVLPEGLSRKFKDLDYLIRKLLSSSQDSALIIAPYLTPNGIDLIKDSIFISASRGSWIRIVTSDLENRGSFNRLAIQRLIDGDNGEIIRSRLRILRGAKDLSILLHSKIIVVDSKAGYLGSANISFSAFEKNFEVGVELSQSQASSIDNLVTYWESQGLLEDCTYAILA